MNKVFKSIAAILIGLVVLYGTVTAQTDATSGATPVAPQQVGEEMPVPHCPGMMPMNFAPVNACYLPEQQMFVLVDSIDCAVDILQRTPDGMTRVGRFVTDSTYKRHDLKAIIRPRSVTVIDGKAVLLASAQKDSSYIAVLRLDTLNPLHVEIAKPLALVPFSTNANAFGFDPKVGELIVVGKNPVGYDIHVIKCERGLEGIAEASNFHYHVPKQSERIKESDPVGVGLTVVAICVVFIALVCICFIMKGYGSAIMKIQDRRKRKNAVKNNTEMPAPSKDVAGEVYAAIAAAIYLYDQDQHDEEDTVITIQKVERAWTPWNAKFYNMNKYFNNRR